MLERRQSKRKHASVKIDQRSNPVIPAYFSENLSRRGICIVTSDPFEIGTVLDLSLNLGPRTIEVQGKVIWSQADRDPKGRVGIQIIQIRPEDQQTLERFVK